MKIAIVGSGISGLTAAHLLYREHDITLFEAADRVGAQAHTMNVSLDGRDYAIDVGFAVFSDQTCPNFSALLDRLGVPFRPTENSYSVHDRASGLEYKGSNLNTLFAQRSNLFRLPFWTMLREIRRFNRESLDDHANKRIAAQVTLGEYLRLGGYGERFIDHYIVPMGGATWSMSRRQLLQTPLECFIRLFESLGLLSAGQDRRWYVVDGGSRACINPLTRAFGQRIRLNCPVFEVLRDRLGVTVLSPLGAERFDKIVFACHSDQALRLISQPSRAETDILGALRYVAGDVVLHTDTALLPTRLRAWASWNYRLGDTPAQPASVTCNVSRLQGLDAPETFLVSLNQAEAINPARVLGRYSYAQPRHDLQGLAAQKRANELRGANHSYFCGAYWGSGLHQDGVISAMQVANALQMGTATAGLTERNVSTAGAVRAPESADSHKRIPHQES